MRRWRLECRWKSQENFHKFFFAKFCTSLIIGYSSHMPTVEHKVTNPQLEAYNRFLGYGLDHAQAMRAVGANALTPKPPSATPPPEQDVTVTRNQLNLLLLEAHKKSATATEEVAAIRELGKLNSLYDAPEADITINIQQNVHKLEVMSDTELLKLAGRDETLLSMPEVIDGEYEEVEE